jgi:hypothetical protein
MVRYRLSGMRFFCLDVGDTVTDENNIPQYRNRLTENSTIEALIEALEQQLRDAGYLMMAGQMVDVTLVPRPKTAKYRVKRAAIKMNKSIRQTRRGKRRKTHLKDVGAH